MALLDDNNDVRCLNNNPEYSIYSLNGNSICLFCVPENIKGTLGLYLDLNMEKDYNELLQGAKTQQQVVEKVGEDYKLLNGTYPSSVYVVPNFNNVNLSNALNTNDKQAIFNAIGGIGNDTKKIQSILASKGIALDSKIIVVEKSDTDKQFANWLKEQNIGEGVSFGELNKVQNFGNPFVSAQPLQGEVVNNVSVSSNPPIFGEPVVQSASDPAQGVQQVHPTQPQMSVPSLQSTQVIPSVQGPAPVQGVVLENPNLDNTTTLQAQPQGYDMNGPSVAKVRSRKLNNINNRGYVNIVVLMAVIVGVTLLSIQLGKFLYSIYG